MMPMGENPNVVGYLDLILDNDIRRQIEPAPLAHLCIDPGPREPDFALSDLRMHPRNLDLYRPLSHLSAPLFFNSPERTPAISSACDIPPCEPDRRFRKTPYTTGRISSAPRAR
jgi:hypothetical protein